MTALPYLAQLNTLIAEPRKPRCRWCSNHGTRDDGNPCSYCNYGEPERDDDLDMED